MSEPSKRLFETAPNLPVTHGFTTRYGGVSSGIFATLNLGKTRGDDPACVAENYERLAGEMGFSTAKMAYTHQVHGNRVLAVTSAQSQRPFETEPYEADGLITDEPGLALMIYTADCVPVLLYDAQTGAVGAVHAGWRGSVQDIVGCGVRAMAERYGCRPENIRAAIGPCISVCCFETGPEVPEAMTKCAPSAASAFIRPGAAADKFMVDLKGFNRHLLLRAGLREENIWVSDECTMCSHEKYWSHRYTHGQRGSQAAVIISGGPQTGGVRA